MSEDRIDPDRARARFRRAQAVIGAFMAVAFFFQIGPSFIARLVDDHSPRLVSLIAVSATVVLVATGIVYARLKGRSSFWGLVGIIGCIGYFILLSLAKHCVRCGARGDATSDQCRSCSAPL